MTTPIEDLSSLSPDALESSEFSGARKIRPPEFGVVDYFTTFFAKWRYLDEEQSLLVQLFPRAGAQDRWTEPRIENGRYIPGRGEEQSRKVRFPADSRSLVESACHKVTYGVVYMDFVSELGAWVLKFEDAVPKDQWLSEGGLLEQFVVAFDALLDPPSE